ncbi:MAG TPA: FecR domain-containing protein [Puia sp.]
MQPEEQIREILERYKRGQASPQEIALLEKWYERIIGKEEEGDQDTAGILSASDEDRLAGALRMVIDAQPARDFRAARRPFLLRPSWRSAAVWIGLIVLGGWSFIQLHKRSQRSPDPQQVAFNEITTGYEQLRKIILPDSSVVWLNSATHLSVHPDFARHRELKLKGEAFFEVRHDANHPFVVQAGNASTVVFGTAFNISAYPAAGQLRISLQSGRIGVRYDSKTGKTEKMLSPGQLLIYDKESGTGEIEQQSPGEMDVWTVGRLVFYKTPLKEALAQIEARYGLHIIYDDVLKNQTITARFENTALEKVLEHLSFGWDLHFSRQNDTLHVR